MNPKSFMVPMMILFLAIVLVFLGAATAEEPRPFIPDKALCVKMLRFGKQAYQRGKYLDAKEYFRKAVQADPSSGVAWRYYDQATIFALAEKVEKNAGLTLPDLSTREEVGTGTPSSAPTPPPPPTVPSKKGTEFKIVEDEGC